jgi:hypothetical protein
VRAFIGVLLECPAYHVIQSPNQTDLSKTSWPTTKDILTPCGGCQVFFQSWFCICIDKNDLYTLPVCQPFSSRQESFLTKCYMVRTCSLSDPSFWSNFQFSAGTSSPSLRCHLNNKHQDECHRPIRRMPLRAGVTESSFSKPLGYDNSLDLGQPDADCYVFPPRE